jgi:hypothetical protein
MERFTVAVFIGTENNPEILDQCLQTMDFADELIISDLSTNDRIEKLLKEKYPKARHFYDTDRNIKNRIVKYEKLCNSDYMMLSSFDEFFTRELGEEILEALKLPFKYDALQISSMEYSFGTCFGRGTYHNKVIKKGALNYSIDNVHEFAKVNGNTIRLKNYFDHMSNPYLAINAVKMFKFEMANAAARTDEQLKRESLEKMSKGQLYKNVFLNLLRLNVRFIRTFWHMRKYGFGALCYAYVSTLRLMAEHVSSTQELQIREGILERNDTRGYL